MPDSSPRKRSVRVAGHPTSVSLEDEFWEALSTIVARQGRPMTGLIDEIDAGRGNRSLSSAIRVYVLAYFRARSEARSQRSAVSAR